MTAFGLLGLVVGELARSDAGITQAEQAATPFGALLMWFFSGCLVVGMFIMVPVSSFLERRAHRLDDVPLERRQLPGWLGWPLWTIVTAGSLFLTYMLIVHVISLVLGSS